MIALVLLVAGCDSHEQSTTNERKSEGAPALVDPENVENPSPGPASDPALLSDRFHALHSAEKGDDEAFRKLVAEFLRQPDGLAQLFALAEAQHVSGLGTYAFGVLRETNTDAAFEYASLLKGERRALLQMRIIESLVAKAETRAKARELIDKLKPGKARSYSVQYYATNLTPEEWWSSQDWIRSLHPQEINSLVGGMPMAIVGDNPMGFYKSELVAALPRSAQDLILQKISNLVGRQKGTPTIQNEEKRAELSKQIPAE